MQKTMSEARADIGNRECENKLPRDISRFHFPLSAFAIFVLVFAAFWPALHGQFIWDDQLLVIKNPLVTGQLNLRTVWFQTDFSLTTVALWLQWLVFGKNPMGYHAVNLFFHAASCVLLWRVLARLKIPGALFAALIFAVHPVAAMSVAWISEMKNTLSLFFFLLSFLWFLNFETFVGTNENKPQIFYALSLAAFLFALLAKTSTVMLPVIMLLVIWWQRKQITRRDWLRLAPFFALAILLGVATMWFQDRVMRAGDPVQTENFFGRFAGAGKAVWFYLGKVLFPVNLSMIYPRWTIHSADALAYLPSLAWLGVLTAFWFLRVRAWARAAFFAFAIFTVALLPVLGFLSMNYLVISRVSDHFQYLPMIAIVALTAAALAKFLPRNIFPAIAAALVLVFAALTFQRSEILADNESLWRDTLTKNPGSFTAQNDYGVVLASQNKLSEAMEHFKAAIELRPKNAPAHANLGRAYAIQRDYADAEKEFQIALSIKSNDAEIQQSYASVLAEQGKFDEAIQHLREAVRLEPSQQMRLQLGSLLHRVGNVREAVEQYRAVLSRDANSIEALNNLAWILATSRDDSVRNGADAVRLAERACELTQRKNPVMLGTLAAAYAEAGRFDDAVKTATDAANLADAMGNSQFAAMNRQLVNFYRAGKPFRE
jgi:tetratricopeptide (TPR) repeat protein